MSTTISIYNNCIYTCLFGLKLFSILAKHRLFTFKLNKLITNNKSYYYSILKKCRINTIIKIIETT